MASRFGNTCNRRRDYRNTSLAGGGACPAEAGSSISAGSGDTHCGARALTVADAAPAGFAKGSTNSGIDSDAAAATVLAAGGYTAGTYAIPISLILECTTGLILPILPLLVLAILPFLLLLLTLNIQFLLFRLTSALLQALLRLLLLSLTPLIGISATIVLLPLLLLHLSTFFHFSSAILILLLTLLPKLILRPRLRFTLLLLLSLLHLLLSLLHLLLPLLLDLSAAVIRLCRPFRPGLSFLPLFLLLLDLFLLILLLLALLFGRVPERKHRRHPTSTQDRRLPQFLCVLCMLFS